MGKAAQLEQGCCRRDAKRAKSIRTNPAGGAGGTQATRRVRSSPCVRYCVHGTFGMLAGQKTPGRFQGQVF